MKRVRKEKNTNKIIKTIIISLIAVIIYEFLFKYILKRNSTIYLYNVILETAIISFVLMHFSLGLKKMYSFIIENRFILSIVLIISTTVLGFFGNSIRN